ncbi:hypothetical protein CsSME_00007775 [Camellia sinensis var. sinensis]
MMARVDEDASLQGRYHPIKLALRCLDYISRMEVLFLHSYKI